MAEVVRDGDRILIGDKVIIESGPALIEATATEELLSDAQTAYHYAVGQPDAKGKKIALGEPFSYLAYGGSETEGRRVFYIFEKVDLSDADREDQDTIDEFRWIERGTRATEDGAIAIGQTIAGE